MPEPSLLRKWLLLSSLVGIAVFLTVYSYTIFYLKSGSQLLAVHVDDNWLRNQGGKLTLLVDGDQHAISTAPKDSAPMTVEVTFGKHTFSVTHGDVVVHDPQTFEISKNGRRILSITPVEMQLLHNRPVSGTADGDVVAGTEMPDEPPDQSRTTAEAAALKNASEVTVANSTVNNSAPGSRSEIREHRPEAAPHALAQTQSQNADDGSGINSSLKLISQVHGATEKQLNRWTQTLPDGYRPYWISLRAAGPEIRFDALARTAPMQTECVLEHYVAGNTADDRRYEKRWGPFRPAIDNVYEEAGSMKRQVLWGKDGPHWKKHFGDEVQIKEKITAGFHNVNADTSQPEHFIPTNLSARYFGESVNYELAQAYGPYTEGEFLPNLTMAEIASKIKGYHKKRWRLHLLAGIRNAPDSRYCVVFVKNGSTFRKWAVSPRLTVAQYEELLQKIDARGGWPRCVASTIEDGNIVYSVLWDEITQQGLKSISIVSDPNSPMTRPEDF